MASAFPLCIVGDPPHEEMRACGYSTIFHDLVRPYGAVQARAYLGMVLPDDPTERRRTGILGFPGSQVALADAGDLGRAIMLCFNSHVAPPELAFEVLAAPVVGPGALSEVVDDYEPEEAEDSAGSADCDGI